MSTIGSLLPSYSPMEATANPLLNPPDLGPGQTPTPLPNLMQPSPAITPPGTSPMTLGLRNFTADLLYSLATGLSAASKEPGQRGTLAGMGQALIAPMQRRQIEQNTADERRLKEAENTRQDLENQSQIKLRDAQAAQDRAKANEPRVITIKKADGSTFETAVPHLTIGDIVQTGAPDAPKPTGDMVDFRALYPNKADQTPENFSKFKQGQLAQPRPPVPVAGRDIPFPPDVEAQRTREAAIKQAAADAKIAKAAEAKIVSPEVVSWIADQVQADTTGQVISKYTAGNPVKLDQVTQELARRGVNVETRTAATRTKAETAGPVASQADDLIAFANDPKNADLFGKVNGRWANLMAGKIGTDDPRMAALAPKIRSLASLLAPLHGFRSNRAAEEFVATMPVMDSPAAFAQAIQEYKNVAGRVAASGQAGPAAGAATHRYNPATGQIEAIK